MNRGNSGNSWNSKHGLSIHHGQDISNASLYFDEGCDFMILCIWCALFTYTSRVLDKCCRFAYLYEVDTRVATVVHRIFAASRSQDNLPKEIQDQLQHPQGALLGDGLAACMINAAENELKKISKIWTNDLKIMLYSNPWTHGTMILNPCVLLWVDDFHYLHRVEGSCICWPSLAILSHSWWKAVLISWISWCIRSFVVSWGTA